MESQTCTEFEWDFRLVFE